MNTWFLLGKMVVHPKSQIFLPNIININKGVKDSTTT